ncbi:hypothetical protein Tco_1242981, partial [Tanacetum coccineum]
MKAKLSLLEASPSTYQNPNTLQPKNKGLVAKTFDWDEEAVSDDEEVIEVKVPMALADNELSIGKNHAHTFRAKPTERLSQTYTRYKTLLNELANDGVNVSKHEINVGFMNSLPEKWLTFSQGPRNANHTQTLDLAYIYGRFVYEENLIQR